MTAAALNPFQLWLADAVRAAGGAVPAEADPLGLSFEAEGHVVRVFPHADDALAVIEVTALPVSDLAEDDVSRLAVQLLRLNHEARFEHGWSIVIDDSDRLNVTTTVAVSGTPASLLGEILYDGIDRAQSLSTVVAGLMSAETEAASGPETGASPGAGLIRG